MIVPFSRLPRPLQAEVPCDTGVVLRQAPRFVRLFFNERVDLVGRGVRVLSPNGRSVEEGRAQVSGAEVSVEIAAAEPGTYRVIWRVVASDTHPAQGTFVFSVGGPSGSPRGGAGGPAGSALGLALQTAARALHLAGYALGFGVFAFRRLVLAPLSFTENLPSERRVWSLVGAGVLLLLSAEPLALVAQTVSLSGGGPVDLEVMGGALDSSFGRVLAQRLAAAVLLWVVIGAARNGHIGEAETAWAALLLSAVAAVIDGEAAHAVGARPVWFGLGLNAVHEAAMALWIGGLLGLLAVYRLPRLAARRSEIVTRVTRIAAVSVLVLMITGTAMAAEHLTGLRDLIVTPYGRALLMKISVLAGGLVMASIAASAPITGRARWWMREAAVLFCVLVLAGLVVSLQPPE